MSNKAVIVAVRHGDRWWTVDHPDRGVCLPGGKIDPGETAEQAACRELYEETGIRLPPTLLEAFAIGHVGGEVDYTVTAFLAAVDAAFPLGRGEPELCAAPRSVGALMASPWAAQYDFHRMVYERLART